MDSAVNLSYVLCHSKKMISHQRLQQALSSDIGMLLYALLVATIFFGATLSQPTNATRKWAQFYDDDSCAGAPGLSVSLSNPACLNEAGRRSFKLHGYDFGLYFLISSPSSDCPCQSYCTRLTGRDDGCFKLQGSMLGASYRFVGRQNRLCPQNQC